MAGDLFEKEKRKYDRMHRVPGYSSGPGAAHVKTFLNYARPGESVIDFGCGSGDAAVKLIEAGHRVALVDISDAGLRHAFNGDFYRASLHDLPWELPRANWGFCCDVMEHLPEAWVGPALAGMHNKVDSCFFSISTSPDSWGPEHIGEPLHLTVRPADWWKERIRAHWPVLASLDGPGDVLILVASDPQAQGWKARFDEIWQRGNYRLGSMELRMAPFTLEWIGGQAEVNVYCCGTGRAVVAYHKAGIPRINMTDISALAVEPEAMALVGAGATFTQAPLWRLPADFPVVEWGCCIDALMTVPPDLLDGCLAEIRRTCRNLVVEVYDWDDVRCGMNLTTVQGDRAWWHRKLAEYFPEVLDFQGEADRRYVFVCRG